jgi:hypothetical protein
MRRRGLLLAALAALLCTVIAPTGAAAGPDGVAARLAAAAAPADQLEPVGRTAAPGGGVIRRYRQRAGGLAVFDAEVVVADPPGAAPILVTDTTVARAGAAGADLVALSRAEAIRRAVAVNRVERLRAPARARLGIDPRSGGAAWEVSLPAARPLADLVVLIDARDGNEISTRDLLWHASAAATLFDPNPVVTQGSYAGLRDAKDHDSALLTALRVPVTLPRITSPKGCLVGVYADARLGKRAKPVCRPSLDFTGVTRSSGLFEALMAYFHVDRTRAYVDGLGLSRALRPKPQKVRANGISADNSYYSSLTHSMTLGTGGVDDGEDADVIVHEYGHSLQDQAVQGFGRGVEAGSMGEGFGDYLAAAMSALGTGGDPRFDPCIFDWDGVSYSRNGCGRSAAKTLDLPQAKRRCGRQIHCLGEVWSSALYELRLALGTDAASDSVTDRVVLESHFMLGRRAKFRDGARALIAADQLLYAGAHAATIETEMVARGFCPAAGC